MMKLFYVKSCKWWVNDRYFHTYRDAVMYRDGYRAGAQSKNLIVEIRQKEYVKMFAYDYTPSTETLRVAQVVWRYHGQPSSASVWSKKLRQSHLKTVQGRFEKNYYEFTVPLTQWEQSLYTNREKLIQKVWYNYFFAQNECDNDSSDEE